MGFNKVYRSLFNVDILHHYFLNEGEWVYGFTPGPSQDDQDAVKAMEVNLSKYLLSSFMDIQPTKKTVTTLKNYRSRFIQSKHGFQVVMATDGNSPFIPFSEDLSFDFIVRITDQYFENYTNITINRSEPLFLSNVTPEIPAEPKEGEEKTAIPVKFCLLSKFKTALTNGIAPPPLYPLLPTPKLPMISREVELNNIEPRELLGAFAIIRIHLVGEEGEIKLTDIDKVGAQVDPNPNGAKEFNSVLPEVKLMFENRSTFWKYHRSKDSVQVYATTEELPLTKNGFVSVPVPDALPTEPQNYPNPSVRMIYNGENGVYFDTSGDPITEDINLKYSRIFIKSK